MIEMDTEMNEEKKESKLLYKDITYQVIGTAMEIQ
jgi:hypothetical protein